MLELLIFLVYLVEQYIYIGKGKKKFINIEQFFNKKNKFDQTAYFRRTRKREQKSINANLDE